MRQISRRASEDEGGRINSEGVDALNKRSPVKRVLSYLIQNALSVVAADKEGDFAVFSYGGYDRKANEAITAVFNQHKEISLAKVKSRAVAMYRDMNLNKVLKGMKKKSKNNNFDVFFSAKTHKEGVPFRVIVSEKGTWQKSIAIYIS